MGSTSKIFGSSMTLFKWFWNDDIWLPPNVTWTDLEQSEIREGVAVPKFSHLWYPIPASLIVIAIRYIVERWDYFLIWFLTVLCLVHVCTRSKMNLNQSKLSWTEPKITFHYIILTHIQYIWNCSKIFWIGSKEFRGNNLSKSRFLNKE